MIVSVAYWILTKLVKDFVAQDGVARATLCHTLAMPLMGHDLSQDSLPMFQHYALLAKL